MQERSSRPGLGAGPDGFSLSSSREDGVVIVGISGELDCVTAPILEERLQDLLADQGNLRVVLDLEEMTFVDSSGLSVLVAAYQGLRARGGQLSLRRPGPSTQRVFEITGLNRVLPTDDL